MSDVKDTINSLTDLLNEAGKAYYTEDKIIMSDYDYDIKLKELQHLEELYPQYKSPNSPTNKIGGEVITEFTKVKHTTKMYSLSNVYSPEELQVFLNKILENYPNLIFIAELKIDGLAVNLEYLKGKLVRATTRGDGTTGEDVTHNVKTIKTIPHKLTKDIDITIRGEVYLTYQSFLKINENQRKKGLDEFANPRNAAAGTLRQLDSKISSERGLSAIFYQIVNPFQHQLFEQDSCLVFLKELGFNISEDYKIIDKTVNLKEVLDNFEVLRTKLTYPTDGAVFKVNNLKLHEEIGYTSKYPKWAIAYKFAPEKVQTKLNNIIFQVGRTGVLTPVAILEPVQLDGSVVGRATLHNYNYIKNKDIRVGDQVIINKAAEIIPEVVNSLPEFRTSEIPFEMITSCPSCGSEVIYSDPELYCSNKECKERKIFQIVHFVSRDALNIDGLGIEIVRNLYEENYINDVSDIFILFKEFDRLKNSSFLGNKTKGNDFKRLNSLINSIENSKSTPFERVLYGLGIDFVGLNVAKILVKNFSSIEDIINAKVEDYIKIKDIGPQIANSLVSYFSDEKNLIIIKKLQESGFVLQSKVDIEKLDTFLNFTFVITGSFEGYSRNDLVAIIEKHGGHSSTSVSKKTTYLLLGSEPGSKYDDAVKLGINILSIEQFFQLLEKN
jgi:DNA ligase (NAD+)